MTERGDIITNFLSGTNWASASVSPLAGDASLRKYYRIGPDSDGRIAVLMDADPNLGNNVKPFINITEFLRNINLSAPEIFVADVTHGLLILEDLGVALFAKIIVQEPHLEQTLYRAATDLLFQLHQAPPPPLEPYNASSMTKMAALAFDWYQFGTQGNVNKTERTLFTTLFYNALTTKIAQPSVLIQRDYHAENLLWLPDRTGHARVGLLDYQDAQLGHPAYDLVSFLKDARRDVPKIVETSMINRYCKISGTDQKEFKDAYHLLGLQRNLRILGVFARLSMHFGKPSYIDLIPRIWEFIRVDLNEPINEQFAQSTANADTRNFTKAKRQMRNDPNAVMLFAAGFGTRMGTLTKNRPKSLVNVAGRTLLNHALEQVDGISLKHKVANCHYFPEQIRAHLSRREDITVVQENDEILETGGGLKNALPLLGNEPVFTLNTDAVWHGANPLIALKAAWKSEKMDALLLCVSLKAAIGHTRNGDFIYGADDRISYGSVDVYTGLQIIKTDRLAEITKTSFSLKLLWDKLLAEERMFGLQYSGQWCDVGTPEGVNLAEEMLGYVHV